MLLSLIDGERSVADLLEPLDATQSALSQHLGVLRKAGLVSVKRSGRHQIYSLQPEGLQEVVDWMHHFDRFWDDRFSRLGRYLARKRKEGRPS